MVLESLEDSTGLRKGGHRLLPTELRSCSVPPRGEGGADPPPPTPRPKHTLVFGNRSLKF